MADYYVRTTGSDRNAGTSAGAAWLTLGHAMNNVADGDTIWVGGGTYRISATIAPKNMGAMTYLIGDTDGAMTGDPGEVVISGWATDTSVSANIPAFTLASKSYWTIRKLVIHIAGGTSSRGFLISGTSANITISEVVCIADGFVFWTVNNALVANGIIERCYFLGRLSGVFVTLTSAASGSDWDCNITVRNCVGISPNTVPNPVIGIDATTTSTTSKGGGVKVLNNLLIGNRGVSAETATYLSTTSPILVYNNILYCGGTAINASTAGQITENYNLLAGYGTARANVSAGANSVSNFSRPFNFSFGHEHLFNAVVRSFGMPGSPTLPTLSWGGTSVPAGDMAGAPRPGSGTGGVVAALGPYERGNNGIRETSTVPPAAGEALRIKGPGYHEFELAVGSNATTVGVQARYDAAYAGILPQLWVVNGGEAGVSATSNTMTAAANTWEKVTVGPFTPSKNGIVTVRLQSNSTGSNSNAYFGSFSLE